MAQVHVLVCTGQEQNQGCSKEIPNLLSINISSLLSGAQQFRIDPNLEESADEAPLSYKQKKANTLVKSYSQKLQHGNLHLDTQLISLSLTIDEFKFILLNNLEKIVLNSVAHIDVATEVATQTSIMLIPAVES